MTARLQLALLPVVAAVLVAAFPVTGVAGGQDGGDPERGGDVFAQSCAMCHGDDGGGMGSMHPSLRGAVDRLTREGVEVAIRNGREVTPPMPAFGDQLTDEEIADVIAYVGSLPPGPRQPDGGPMDGGGMGDGDGMDGGMMDGMTGDDTVLWVVIVVLAATAAGLAGYVLAHRRSR